MIRSQESFRPFHYELENGASRLISFGKLHIDRIKEFEFICAKQRFRVQFLWPAFRAFHRASLAVSWLSR